MSRSQAVRNEALALDDHRCQITGKAAKDGAILEVHHVQPLGMGGSDALDTVENCITLEARIHQMVESGALVIARWTRGAEFEVIDNQDVLGFGKGRLDHKHLWFHRRHKVEELEQIETRIHGLAMLDMNVAKDLYELKRDKNWRELEPGVSFAAYCASRGWNASKASSLANLYAKSLKLEVEWPDGETETDFRRRLKDLGAVEPREYWHCRVKDESVLRDLIGTGSLRIYRCTDDDAADMEGIGFKIGKMFGLRSEDEGLMSRDGEPIAVSAIDSKP